MLFCGGRFQQKPALHLHITLLQLLLVKTALCIADSSSYPRSFRIRKPFPSYTNFYTLHIWCNCIDRICASAWVAAAPNHLDSPWSNASLFWCHILALDSFTPWPAARACGFWTWTPRWAFRQPPARHSRPSCIALFLAQLREKHVDGLYCANQSIVVDDSRARIKESLHEFLHVERGSDCRTDAWLLFVRVVHEDRFRRKILASLVITHE
jgi:hypothetical protein